jgi:hypothetical protein
MRTAAIVVDLLTLKMTPDSLTGIIYLQQGEVAFPQNQWQDNVAIILSWWLDNLRENENEFFFMDGPFSFTATQGELRCLSHYKAGAVSSIVLRELLGSMVAAAESVLQHFQTNSPTHSDLIKLASSYGRLKQSGITYS